MKLLLDANVSWKLINRLKDLYQECYHVDHIGLTVPAKDTEIWDYAKGRELIIVTNDDDFLNLSDSKGFPPKVILLRTGNQSTTSIENLLRNKFREIDDFDTLNLQGCLEIL